MSEKEQITSEELPQSLEGRVELLKNDPDEYFRRSRAHMGTNAFLR